MAFPQKQQFVFKHFTTVFLSVLPTHFMHWLFRWSFVVKCLQNHPHYLTRSSYIPVRYVVRYRQKVFVWGEMYSYSFTSGKTYLVIQTWRIVKWATTWQNHKVTVRPAKTQISLGIRPVWSESSLSAWIKLGSLATHSAHSEDSDQTGRMLRLICLRWAHTYFVGFVMSWLKWFRYPCYVNCVPTTLFNLSPSIFGGRSGILP